MKGGVPHKMEVLKVMVIGFCNSRARSDMATKSTKKKEDAQDSKKKWSEKEKALKGEIKAMEARIAAMGCNIPRCKELSNQK